MQHLLVALLAVIGLSAVQSQQTFVGVVTDDMCPLADHAGMQMGPSDAECARACADAHGAQYVLYDGKAAYVLSDQPAAQTFAGRRVRVVGALDRDSRVIRVQSIAAAQ